MTRIKICGITDIDDALAAAEAGAHALGFVFAPSPRRADPGQVNELVRQLPPYLSIVGVFVDEKEDVVKETAELCKLNTLQFHGQESPQYCSRFSQRVIKAVKLTQERELTRLRDYQVAAFLIDSRLGPRRAGGGETVDWQLAGQANKYGKIILSGGLTPANVGRAIRLASPAAVDVSGGVESAPGKKNLSKIRDFIKAVNEADLGCGGPSCGGTRFWEKSSLGKTF